MKLSEYMHVTGETPAGMARSLDTSWQTVKNYMTGNRIPEAAIMTRIVAATNGAVQPNDFYDLPTPPKRRGKGSEIVPASNTVGAIPPF